MVKTVYCEIDPDTHLPIRISKHAYEGWIQLPKSKAVNAIRKQVIERATRERLIRCEFCDKILTENTGHMHEIVPKGMGGEVSLENSRFICAECHIGRDGEHGNRRFHSSKNKDLL